MTRVRVPINSPPATSTLYCTVGISYRSKGSPYLIRVEFTASLSQTFHISFKSQMFGLMDSLSLTYYISRSLPHVAERNFAPTHYLKDSAFTDSVSFRHCLFKSAHQPRIVAFVTPLGVTAPHVPGPS